MRIRTLLFVALGALLVVGCAGRKEDPVLQLSASEALEQGRELMDAGKYEQARKLLSHAFEVEPNSLSGREALLLVADSLYLQGGTSNSIQAEAKYRDFLNRFPTSDRIDYVQFQIASSLAQRVEKPDRDQTVTRQAIAAFEDLVRLHPGSEHVPEAREKLRELRDHLAEHEMVVARFYYRYGLPGATISRLEFLLERFPAYTGKDEVYYYLGMAESRRGDDEEAREWFERLRSEHPDSEWASKIPEGEA